MNLKSFIPPFELRLPLFLFLVYFMGFIGAVYMHEASHIEINKAYGIKSHQDWINYAPHVATVSEGNYSNCTSNCVLAHNIADAFFYPMIIFYGIWGIVSIASIGIKSIQEN